MKKYLLVILLTASTLLFSFFLFLWCIAMFLYVYQKEYLHQTDGSYGIITLETLGAFAVFLTFILLYKSNKRE